jgi:hypothetical protein
MEEDTASVTRHIEFEMDRDKAASLFEKVNNYRKKQINGKEKEETEEEKKVALKKARESGLKSRREEINEVRGAIKTAIEQDDRLRTLLDLWLDARGLFGKLEQWSNSIGNQNLEIILRQMWKRDDNK